MNSNTRKRRTAKETYAHYRRAGKCVECPEQAQDGLVRCRSCNERIKAKLRARSGGVPKGEPNPYGHGRSFTGKAPREQAAPLSRAQRIKAGLPVSPFNRLPPAPRPQKPKVIVIQDGPTTTVERPGPPPAKVDVPARVVGTVMF